MCQNERQTSNICFIYLTLLGMKDVSLARRIAMKNALDDLNERIQTSVKIYKTERYLKLAFILHNCVSISSAQQIC